MISEMDIDAENGPHAGQAVFAVMGNLLHKTGEGLFMMDAVGKIIACSQECLQLTGMTESALMEHAMPPQMTEPLQQIASWNEAFFPGKTLISGQHTQARRLIRQRRDAHVSWFEVTYHTWHIAHKPAGMAGFLRMITDQTGHVTVPDSLVHAPLCVTPVEPLLPETPVEMVKSDEAEGYLDLVLVGVERREILRTLRECRGQRTKAAKILGISRSRLYRRMEVLGIETKGKD